MDNKKFETLIIDGIGYKTLYTKKYKKRKKWLPIASNEIKTSIPGTMVKLNVKTGDKVKQGEVLCLFEAMKMQNIIRADSAGTIIKINASEGDRLPKDFAIMIIDKNRL
jgi:biotin carboxyl carrier protein